MRIAEGTGEWGEIRVTSLGWNTSCGMFECCVDLFDKVVDILLGALSKLDINEGEIMTFVDRSGSEDLRWYLPRVNSLCKDSSM